MSTQVRQEDVVNLAAVLLGIGATNGSAAYRPGALFFEVLQLDLEFDAIVIDVSAQTSNLPQGLAMLGAVQLALDAAATAVEFRYRTRHEPVDDPQVVAMLYELGPDFGWDLEVLELRAGSIKARLRKVFYSLDDRKKAMAVAVLAGAVTGAIIPASLPVSGLIIACLSIGDAFFPAKPFEVVAELARMKAEAAQAEGEAAEAKAAEAEANVAQIKADVARLMAANQKLAEALQRVEIKSIDKNAAEDAGIDKLTTTLENNPAPE